MTRISQPVNQVRLTNVAIVRLKRNGKRFEIACYKNKVVNWRNRVETDISEVLQIDSVFSNVSKGILAKNTDLMNAFDTTVHREICQIILDKGELQVSDKERKSALESMYRDIATIIADKCVNPESNRPYPFTVIERLMKEIHFSPSLNKSSKQQALEVIKRIKSQIPIERAKMKIQICLPVDEAIIYLERLKDLGIGEIEKEQKDEINYKFICFIDPGLYRTLDKFINSKSGNSFSMELIELSCLREGDHSIDDEIQQKNSHLETIPTRVTDQEDELTTKLIPNENTLFESKIHNVTGDLHCSCCGGNFGENREIYREHFKSDWHRYNLKLRAKHLPSLTETEFQKLNDKQIQEFFQNFE